MKTSILLPLVILFVAGLIFSACAAPAPTLTPTPSPTPTLTPTPSPTPTLTPIPSPAAKSIVLKAVSFLPTTTPTIKSNVPKFAQRVKERSNGQLTIQFLGGPEVIPPTGLAEALTKNIVQIAFIAPENYEGMSNLGSMTALSELTPDEERTSGAYDYINELHKKIGLFYLERTSYSWTSNQFNIISNKLIDIPQQLAGQKIGATTPILVPFCKAIGASPVIIGQTDYYTALERGVVDGIAYPLQNSMALQLYEVTKYVLYPAFYRSTLNTILNLDSWNKLPKDQQTMMASTAREVVYEWMDDMDKKIIPDAEKIALDHGMKFIKFSDADSQWYLKMLYDTQWEEGAKRFPEVAAKLRPLLTKK